MRIGIIGAGAAGLTSAWMLEDEHNVTLFEKQNRLGGHAHSVQIDVEGEHVWVDVGAEFFSAKAFPHFVRLLSILGAETKAFPMTATLYSTDHQNITMLPPLQNGKIVWSMLGPKQLANLLRFSRVLSCAKPLMDSRETATTLEEFVNDLNLTDAFKNDFLYPFLLSGWCLELEDYKKFIAYDVLQFVYNHKPAGLRSVPWLEVTGCMHAYVQKLVAAISKAGIETSADIVQLSLADDVFTVRLANGKIFEFDQVIIATSAADAKILLSEMRQTTDIQKILGQVEYFKTKIAVHGDRRLMPANKKHWSVVNMRHDGRHAHTSIWKPWRCRVPVFRSWITFEKEMPQNIYALAEFDHPKTNAKYFKAQHKLADKQGSQGLWFAGMHTHDVETHESAIISAIKVAQKLAPTSSRLKLLQEIDR